MLNPETTTPKISKKNTKKMKAFVDLALEFNKTHNIFARKEPKEVFERDVFDCIPLISEISDKKSVLDLGSGGGFPGIIIGILRPNNKVHLVESSNKKCYFLKKTISELALKNTKVINTNLNKDNEIGKFDIITARAFASTEKIINITKNNTKPSTKYLLLKGTIKKTMEEIGALNKNQYSYKIINQDTKERERNIAIITTK